MNQPLANIYADMPDGGVDLHHRVDVPRSALGSETGFWASVPPRLTDDLGLVRDRYIPQGDRADSILIWPPVSAGDGFLLRLRGMGAAGPEGGIGDLYLQVRLVDDTALATRQGWGCLSWFGLAGLFFAGWAVWG